LKYRLICRAERFDAAEAYRIGLVHDVVERGALHARALDMARLIAFASADDSTPYVCLPDAPVSFNPALGSTILSFCSFAVTLTFSSDITAPPSRNWRRKLHWSAR